MRRVASTRGVKGNINTLEYHNIMLCGTVLKIWVSISNPQGPMNASLRHLERVPTVFTVSTNIFAMIKHRNTVQTLPELVVWPSSYTIPIRSYMR